jgi:hypothetical protein
MSKVTILATLVATFITLIGCKDDESESPMAGAGGQGGQAGDMQSGGAGGQGATSASGGAGAGGQNAGDSPCADLCVVVEALDCPGDSASPCMSQCETYWGGTTCQMELRGMLSCFAAQPQGSWECNAQSMEAEPVAGLCDDEQSALEDCLGV